MILSTEEKDSIASIKVLSVELLECATKLLT